eukprot:TRINITY_DN5871_c0_g1_i1.p1 TRINITY_DN5871_c0_g1~~TRINITY_DN5871_c0_g1_i1.p1  ORF type:complete len:416 (-),score=75.55 TRINITY_DN5871_c0_g1_i1:293-1540(-)
MNWKWRIMVFKGRRHLKCLLVWMSFWRRGFLCLIIVFKDLLIIFGIIVLFLVFGLFFVDRNDMDYDILIEYDADEEDEVFLSGMSESGQDVSIFIFEAIIDYLEKASFKNKEYCKINFEEEEKESNESICCVCMNGSKNGDFILTCGICGLLTHNHCYSVEGKEDPWYCDRCKYLISENNNDVENVVPQKIKKIKCAICFKSEGALKQTKCNRWVHVLCANWIPEIFYDKEDGRIDLSKLQKKRNLWECCICNGIGKCIQCSKPGCYTYYHPSCAVLKGYYTHSLETKDNTVITTYCENHTILKRQDVAQKIISDSDIPVEIGEFITETTISEIMKRISDEVSVDIVNNIIEYWKEKRLSLRKGRVPLIRRLLVGTKMEMDKSLKSKRKKLKIPKEEKYDLLRKYRADLEKVELS